ncbi:Rust resistance kinase Lr10 [Vitis vinifera]|uniref:Rust resistance kinase Lr10 n=1 Tax=Vitis vinifera TaxID=29760 RepID=A0A438IYR9_VITVI|nr:Rust resistance kinase Lr10 [Vitis vinifera]
MHGLLTREDRKFESRPFAHSLQRNLKNESSTPISRLCCTSDIDLMGGSETACNLPVITVVPKTYSLGWEKLQDIAIGIAKGIEYLHQGCDQRILHFDIKPHNILLDENFNPKISDFGLAKLCSKDQSAVSMTVARGTMGYIAPEVLSRNFGNASYKSDVYSFGMLLLEMVGGRKNIDVTMETNQVYFPEWVYNQLDQGEDVHIRIEEEGDIKIAKKLTIVGLWCIQWYPIDRPSMKLWFKCWKEKETI